MTTPATDPEASEAAQRELADSLSDLWSMTGEVWERSFLGLSVGEGLAALGVLILAFIIRGLFARILVAMLQRQTEKTKTVLDDKVLAALVGPLKLVPVIIGVYAAVLIVGLQGDDGEGPGILIVRSLIAVAIFWGLHNAVTPAAHLMKPLQRTLTPVLIDWLTKTLRIVFVVVGAAAVLQVWNIPVAPIVAGFGLFGVAIGLGAQDLFKNLIAGLLILTEKRFLPGDWIQVDNVVEGHVEKINFRSTVVRRFDKGPVYVPNKDLADNAVTNFSRMSHRRIRWMIGVEYKTETAQLQYIRDKTLDFITNHPGFAQPPEVTTFMRVDSFGPSSIDFLLYCFTHTINWTEWLEIKEELAFELKKIVEESGTAFAFPSNTVYVDDGVEVFMPPKVRRHAGLPIEDKSGEAATQSGGESTGDGSEQGD